MGGLSAKRLNKCTAWIYLNYEKDDTGCHYVSITELVEEMKVKSGIFGCGTKTMKQALESLKIKPTRHGYYLLKWTGKKASKEYWKNWDGFIII